MSRRRIDWLTPDRTDARGVVERILAPRSAIAPGWTNWTLEHMPYLFYRLPQARKDRYLRAFLPAAASDWLRHRVIGHATLHEAQSILRTEIVDGRVEATISGGERLTADHAILATGYTADIRRLPMVHPTLLAEIEMDRGVPILSSSFESSVAGLYFVGLTSLRAFGPLFRFVAGCKATARRVAGALGRNRTSRCCAAS